LSPLFVFLSSIPLAFVNAWAAMIWWLVGSIALGFVLSKTLATAPPPVDPVADAS
jgi:hypothetical protein